MAWQGVEPTMIGPDFFRRSVDLVEKYRRPGQQIQYTIPTNGVLLDDRWADFFKANGFLVGLSVDGPRELHDAYRVGTRGKGSFDRMMAGYQHLKAGGVDVNVLCTVHAANQDHPLEVYRFLRDEMGVRFMQFIPIVERTTETRLPLASLGWSTTRRRPMYVQAGNVVIDRTVGPEAFGRFLSDVFDEWVKTDGGRSMYSTSTWYSPAGSVYHQGCASFPETCGLALALEHNGDLYSCDHYVEPDYLLGNIAERR